MGGVWSVYIGRIVCAEVARSCFATAYPRSYHCCAYLLRQIMASTTNATGMLDCEEIPTTDFLTGSDICHAPKKKKNRGVLARATSDDETTVHVVYDGVDGCVYDFKYMDGYVTLSNGSLDCIGMDRTIDLVMHIRDWAIFRNWVCVELNKKRTTVYLGKDDLVWYNPFNSREYMIGGDRINKPRNGFIYFHHRFSADGNILKIRKPDGTVELSLDHTDPDMYQNRIHFVIQWCDWEAVQGVFESFDGIIGGSRFGKEYESIKREVLFGNSTRSSLDFLRARMPETEVLRRTDF